MGEMNGQLSEEPLAELIREISSKGLSGRLRLENDRVKVVTYFENGRFVYAAANLRTLRLREYLKKSGVVSDENLASFDERLPDIELLQQLQSQKLLSAMLAEQVLTKQVSDVLRLALSWTEGSWEFDSRSHLEAQPDIVIDGGALVLEAVRRLPADFVASRFPDLAEAITPLAEPLVTDNLLPAEAFLLFRIDRRLSLDELLTISGLGTQETLQLVYSLALGGLLQREHWKSSLHAQQTTPSPPPPRPRPEPPPPPPPPKSEPTREIDPAEVEAFLARVKTAQTHYDVLAVKGEVSAEGLKSIYYQLARQYHPDRFRKSYPELVARLESAFARITQAYETLRDDTLRANYNSKIAARRKAEQIVDATPSKVETPESAPEPAAERVAEPAMSKTQRAEMQFKEGLAALELGDRKVALGLFASAASTAPNEPRYRAFYGQLLASNQNTLRTAETELLAAIKLDPKNASYRVTLAELYLNLGLKLRAKGEAERALGIEPGNQKARELLKALK